MANLITESEYKAKSKKIHNSHVSSYQLNRFLESIQPPINTEAYREALMLAKLAIEKIKQHNGLMERKQTVLKRNGFIDTEGDKCFY